MGHQASEGNRSIRQSIKEHWREFAAASAGNALEFYDILIYGYFAITIGNLFFPNKDSAVSLLIAVGTFGISFITRPLGSIVLGSYADKAGRKASMSLSISLMVIGTAMITFCPTYETIGILAPLIIIIARMLQGFSTGGEFGSSVAFMVEHAGIDKRGFFASFQMSTQGLATVFAAGLSALLFALLSPEQLNSWGWRLAFAFGLLIGPIGFYIRRGVAETADFETVKSNRPKNTPLHDLFKYNWHDILLCIGVVAAATAFNYVHKIYMPTYAIKQLHLPETFSFIGAVITGFMLLIVSPMVGTISDRFGRIRIVAISFVFLGVTSWPLFYILNAMPTPAVLFAVQAFVGFLLACGLAAIPALIAEIFPTNVRSTGLAVSYNLSVTIFGGFAPLIATWLIQTTHNNMSPSFYVMSTVLLSLISILLLARRHKATDKNKDFS
ncbi:MULTISPECIES: MFS transporter [Bartonella]|uniref:MFS transporter, MHS family, proline/betaine transporter n=1 Tax=Bartonella choladocola TaxID=2750995 RepID=A0A1U9MEU3_9HYPH|nr:MFS transporter [Bartonella choladocola]AQT46230.1 MFS transporter, MHS family, proline/betaine transporter [Bartonella choladocola]MBI0139599.1 MFS transporter [Bartonella choladocola]